MNEDLRLRLRRNALKVIREGRLRVVRASALRGTFHATVRSSQPGTRLDHVVDAFTVDEDRVIWSCSCGPSGGCAHIAAAQLVSPV